MVMGIQNYYRIATNVASDLNKIQRQAYNIMHNRLNTQSGNYLRKTGRQLTQNEKKRYGKSLAMRYIAGTKEPIYPISYVQFKNPMALHRMMCPYTVQGRALIHDRLQINNSLLMDIMKQKCVKQSVEYYDNRISLYTAQYGKCYVTGKEFQIVEDIHCHHKLPKHLGGEDKYDNLVLVNKDVHKLIHASRIETIAKYIELLDIGYAEITKINKLRQIMNLTKIELDKRKRSLKLSYNY